MMNISFSNNPTPSSSLILQAFNEDVFFAIFSCLDSNINDLGRASLVCRSWNVLVSQNCIGKKVLEKYHLTAVREPWMRVYRRWVHHAQYFCLLDVSVSMQSGDEDGDTRISKGKKKLTELALEILPAAVLCLGVFAETFQLKECRSLEEVHEFIRGTNEVDLYPVSDLGTVINCIQKKVTKENALHLHVISDFDFFIDPFERFDQAIGSPSPIRLYFHQMGHATNGTRFIQEQPSIKRNFEMIVPLKTLEQEHPQ